MSIENQEKDPIIPLYKDSFPDFARMIRRMGGTLEEAKDSFHDALLLYLEKERSGKLQLHSSAKAYLLGIAKICWLREKKALTFPFPDGFEPLDPIESDKEEMETDLLRALLKTGKKCMDLLKAFYYEHSPMTEIARQFGFNGSRSATVQKYKCLEKVREEIKTRQTYA